MWLMSSVVVLVYATATSESPNMSDVLEAIQRPGTLFLSMVGTWVTLTGAAVWAVYRGGGLGWKFKPVDLLTGLGLAVLAHSTVVLAGQAWAGAGLPLPANTSSFVGHPVGWLIVLGLGVSVVTPIVEELFFRGVMLGAIQRKFTTAAESTNGLLRAAFGWAKSATAAGVVSALITAVLFGVLHWQDAPVAASLFMVAAASVGGFLFGIARVFTGRLGASIVGHILFNSLSYIAALGLLGG